MLAGKKPRLPSGYQEVEYLFSDGNQRIVLNIFPVATDVITIRYQLSNLSINTGIFGAAEPPYYNGIGTNTNLANFYAQIGGDWDFRQSSIPKDTDVHTHKLDYVNRIYAIDGVETSLSGLSMILANNKYGLWYHNGAPIRWIRYTAAKIYSFDIHGRISLLPCYRKSDNKPGMYDLVNSVFYTNTGTGEFALGPNVN